MPEAANTAVKVRRADFLDRFPFFKDATAQLLEELMLSLRKSEFHAGQQIYREQDPCPGISFLLSGEIRVFKSGPGVREVTLYTVGPGETCILNAACILSAHPIPANAVALSAGAPRPARRRVPPAGRQVPPDAPVRPARPERPPVRHHAVVEEVLFSRVDERLLTYLKERPRSGVAARTHQQIASELGTSREVVSRLLGDLAAGRHIEVSRQRISILSSPVT